jgi:chemotaxis receptor (MCP) glutamine deamidase CheD
MATFLEGTHAKYDVRPSNETSQTTWVYSDATATQHGKTTQVLTSDSYGSCVGLVLYQPLFQAGMVAHFPGSLGTMNNLPTAEADAREILKALFEDGSPYGIKNRSKDAKWTAWVFGGISLAGGEGSDASSVSSTKALIACVRSALAEHKKIVTEHFETKDQDRGSLKVSLNIATGKVVLDADKKAEKEAATRNLRKSG